MRVCVSSYIDADNYAYSTLQLYVLYGYSRTVQCIEALLATYTLTRRAR
jgi:hypothetical protein